MTQLCGGRRLCWFYLQMVRSMVAFGRPAAMRPSLTHISSATKRAAGLVTAAATMTALGGHPTVGTALTELTVVGLQVDPVFQTRTSSYTSYLSRAAIVALRAKRAPLLMRARACPMPTTDRSWGMRIMGSQVLPDHVCYPPLKQPAQRHRCHC